MLLQPFKNHLECPARHFAFYHAVFYADSYFIFIVPRMEVGGVFCLFFWFVFCFPILPKGVACCVLPIFAGEWGVICKSGSDFCNSYHLLWRLSLTFVMVFKQKMKMEKVVDLNEVSAYNQLYGLETFHPLVTVVDLNKATRGVETIRLNYGLYALFLKLEKSCDIQYGRQKYDFQEGTIVCFAPGQTALTTRTAGHPQTNAYGLLFHPDLIAGTALGRNIKRYTFFSYEVNEALHLSEEERKVVLECLGIIQLELNHAVDRHSRGLLVTHIDLLLQYCMRFYERQFATRSKANRDVLERFDALLDGYFESGRAESEGLPSVHYFADKLCLSPNYFGDLFKKETGRTAQDFIQEKIVEFAKGRILYSADTISQIAYSLGFQYPQHFCRLFKKRMGCTPNEFRAQSNA